MKAIVKIKPEKGIWMTDVPMPVIGPNDVLIKIKKSAICGTDLHIYKMGRMGTKYHQNPTCYRTRIHGNRS